MATITATRIHLIATGGAYHAPSGTPLEAGASLLEPLILGDLGLPGRRSGIFPRVALRPGAAPHALRD
jgi:hypothetical protein